MNRRFDHTAPLLIAGSNGGRLNLMPESPAQRLWPPPPETAEVRKEQVKLSAALLNAAAIACIITGFVGPLITAIPDAKLTIPVRLLLLMLGLGFHVAGRTYLRYISA